MALMTINALSFSVRDTKILWPSIHEAALRTVDQRQLETLMADGLTPEETVDITIMGLFH